MNKSKGFTIIELIVVIAIIAVLAAIVLVNVTQYIAKGRDSAIKGDMSTIMANSAVYFDSQSPSTYVGFGASALYTNPSTAAVGAGATGVLEFESASAFCSSLTLNDTTFWCVDSTGYSGAPTAADTCAATNIACK
jgi:prepilin-type N-terminal cleavage/methylation domain-containing protein